MNKLKALRDPKSKEMLLKIKKLMMFYRITIKVNQNVDKKIISLLKKMVKKVYAGIFDFEETLNRIANVLSNPEPQEQTVPTTSEVNTDILTAEKIVEDIKISKQEGDK